MFTNSFRPHLKSYWSSGRRVDLGVPHTRFETRGEMNFALQLGRPIERECAGRKVFMDSAGSVVLLACILMEIRNLGSLGP